MSTPSGPIGHSEEARFANLAKALESAHPGRFITELLTGKRALLSVRDTKNNLSVLVTCYQDGSMTGFAWSLGGHAMDAMAAGSLSAWFDSVAATDESRDRS